MSNTYIEEVTLVQAVAECYNFKPKSKKEIIKFEIRFFDNNNEMIEKKIWFGKGWSKIDKEWRYFEGQTNCPTFSQEARHFLSNLFCSNLAREELIYGAQQGDFKVFRVQTS